MTEELKCEHKVRIDGGKDMQGRQQFWHERCNASASERVLSGMLTTAKAVLCDRHYRLALRETFISERGWPKGKIAKKEKGAGYQQTLISPAIEAEK